ncbi:MAG TPA: hypothetical protein VLA83_13265 [Candidatus Binatia bacterium]|nr:hypothetical protein [Candidatus Binatia bacterium]
MKQFFFLLLVITGTCFCGGADLKITIVRDPTPSPGTSNANSESLLSSSPGYWATIYVQGPSQRVEFIGPVLGLRFAESRSLLLQKNAKWSHLAVITHCDSGVVDELNLDSHEYREFKAPRYLAEKDFQKMAERSRKESEKEIQASTIDTGELRDFFGHVARHKVTTIHHKTSGTRLYASTPDKKGVIYTESIHYAAIEYEETLDGWYVDLPEPGCAPEYLRRGVATPVTFVDTLPSGDVREVHNHEEIRGWDGFQMYSPVLGPVDSSVPLGFRLVAQDASSPQTGSRTKLVYTGFVPTGFPVAQKTSGVMTLKERLSSTSRKETEVPWGYAVTEYSEGPLNPALFDVPPDFKKIH